MLTVLPLGKTVRAFLGGFEGIKATIHHPKRDPILIWSHTTGVGMAEPLDDSKANIDDPIVVEPVVDEPNVVEPDVEEHIVVDTAHFFSSAKKYKVRDDLIGWCRQEALKTGFTVVIG
ncbi:hypothetical protein A2U01_0008404, partial [Trifolium medium]|nr:hypothetical protein [Trifolium medium]